MRNDGRDWTEDHSTGHPYEKTLTKNKLPKLLAFGGDCRPYDQSHTSIVLVIRVRNMVESHVTNLEINKVRLK